MAHLMRTVVVIVVLALHRDSTTLGLNVERDELLINEGDFLEIKCQYSKDFSFIYPRADPKNKTMTIIYSTPKIIKTERWLSGIPGLVFQRPETVHGDTGLYGCPNSSSLFTSPVIHYFEKLVYVYVQSNTSVFVAENNITTLPVRVGDTAVIPCRPTSPNFTVQLLFDNMVEFAEVAQERTNFNPRIGFELKNIGLTDHGHVKCIIEHDGVEHEMLVNLLVFPNEILNAPVIPESSLSHVTRGGDLKVNCTTSVKPNSVYHLNWSTPQQSSRISTQKYKIRFSTFEQMTTELIIKDVMDEDEGWYECFISSFFETKSTKKYIKVHDPGITFINLTSEVPNRHYQGREGDKVQWVVNVHAYPEPVLQWLNTKGEEILGDWNFVDKLKYATKFTPTMTILRINHLNINDMGEYSLQATNTDKFEMLNFTLEVLVKPLVMLKVDAYYAPNQEAKISCDIATFPAPNITWSYTKCPYYNSCENESTELTNTREIRMLTKFSSTVTMTIEMSGYLTCTACNIVGCEYQMEPILVSDVKGGFGIIEPTDPVTEGDDIELICAASIYNYTNNFKWLYDNDSLIQQTDRLTIEETETLFTYRSILKIKNVTKEDSTTYVCINKQQMDYFLQVHDSVIPYVKETNLYENETMIDVNTNHQPLVFKCFVGGMPKPKIAWYKDDKKLKKSEQYMLLHDHQVMEIKYLRETDSGKYSCKAENRFGSIEAYITLKVIGKELPKELIIMIVILVITLVILLIYFTIKIRREKMMRKALMEAGLMHFEEGVVECLNQDLTAQEQAEFLPYDKKWEFPKEKLKLGKTLGSGAFGVVVKAEAEGICENERVTTVAVKMIRQTTDPTCVLALARELKIMVHLGKHLNVVNLLGACTKNISKRELLVIVEYCRFGNLHNYLLRRRADFINQINSMGKFDPTIGLDLLTTSVSVSSNSSNRGSIVSKSVQNSAMDSPRINMSDDCVLHNSNNSSQPGFRFNYEGDYKDSNLKPICTQDLLSWAFQVARGMEYLSYRNVLHGDLAARNILLAENNVVKICDFGLARNMYNSNNYQKKEGDLLPIKWMAIESIRDRIFSTQSDIWSFGIVLWEFFKLAETPYPEMNAEKQYQMLIEGRRLEQPEYATSEVYNIMLQCWEAKPDLRPSFTELVQQIGDLLEEHVRAHYINLNVAYVEMNTKMLENSENDYLMKLSTPDYTKLSSPSHENSNALNSPNLSYLRMNPSNKRNDSGIFSPKSNQEKTHFEFPSLTSDSEDAVELSPMLRNKENDDPYLKPINVQARRAEFVRQRKAINSQTTDHPIDRDSGYCNIPQNDRLIDINKTDGKMLKDLDDNEKANNENTITKKDFIPAIIRTQDNYVNMPKQKNDLRLDVPASFSNPSYTMMPNHEKDQMEV